MPAHLQRAVWLLGLCQCVLWGVLYYSFSVLLVPMEQALGLSRTTVAGAFSAGLLAMALLAPAIGRWLDAGHAARLTRLGMGLAVAGLLLVAFAQGAAMLYLGWLGIGAAMAMLLYEPAFVLVTRAVVEEGARLQALAAVTVMGGLASTIFLPAVSQLIATWGWRLAVVACAAAVLAVAWAMERHVVPRLPASRPPRMDTPEPIIHSGWPRRFTGVVTIFTTSTLASMALTTLLVPLMLARGVTPTTAALVLAALGVAQLPGRIWLLRAGRAIPPHVLHTTPIALQAIGLLVVAMSSVPAWVAAGVAAFGLGAGLHTLARPWLIQRLYGTDAAGRWNGELARVQGFVRAAGPVAASGAAWLGGASAVLTATAGLLVLTLPIARRLQG